MEEINTDIKSQIGLLGCKQSIKRFIFLTKLVSKGHTASQELEGK